MLFACSFMTLVRKGVPTILWLALASIASSQTTSTTERIPVVVSIAPLADWVRQIGGEAVEVTTLVPPGTSPHTFEPSPADLRKMAEARLFVHVGLGLDEWVARLSRTNKNSKLLAIGDVLQKKGLLPKDVAKPKELTLFEKSSPHRSGEKDHFHEHDANGTDPHFWLDPLLAQLATKEIENALSTVAPEGAALWHEGAMRYSRELEQLHREILEQLKACRKAKLVTFHHAFGYFASRYELEIAGVIEMYPGKQPSEREIKGLVQQLRALGVKTIFTEPQMDSRLAEIVAQEIGGNVATLDPEGTSERQSYTGLMRFNAEQIKRALCP